MNDIVISNTGKSGSLAKITGIENPNILATLTKQLPATRKKLDAKAGAYLLNPRAIASVKTAPSKSTWAISSFFSTPEGRVAGKADEICSKTSQSDQEFKACENLSKELGKAKNSTEQTRDKIIALNKNENGTIPRNSSRSYLLSILNDKSVSSEEKETALAFSRAESLYKLQQDYLYTLASYSAVNTSSPELSALAITAGGGTNEVNRDIKTVADLEYEASDAFGQLKYNIEHAMLKKLGINLDR